MLTELDVTLMMMDGSERQTVAHICPEVDKDGMRIYKAKVGFIRNDLGVPLLVGKLKIPVLPAHSTVVLEFDPDKEE